jgi:NADH-quinone oxidoreductase subunit E
MLEMPPRFSEETLKKVTALKNRYPEGQSKSALLPVLHMAQAELGGWLSPGVMDYVATLMELQPVEVYEVATFYTMFHMQPSGQFVLEICRTGPCALVGADEISAYIQKKLGVGLNTVTPDGLFSIKEVECLASCGTGPVLQLGERFVENLTESKIDELISGLKNGTRLDHEPAPPHSILCRTALGAAT